jgi:hypothetical protein
MARVIVDTEVYPNYFLALFKDIASGKFRSFEMYEGVELDCDALARVMRAHTTISFNGLSYDLYILAAAVKGASCAQLKALSDEMIKSKLPSWRVARDKGVQIPRPWDHIDIIEVAPGSASLKVYGGRMHAPTMQDLPIAPDDLISPAQRDQLRVYCKNDVNTTEMLYRKLELPIALREQMSKQYDIDLRSKSDAQMAETVIPAPGSDRSSPCVTLDFSAPLGGLVLRPALPAAPGPRHVASAGGAAGPGGRRTRRRGGRVPAVGSGQ